MQVKVYTNLRANFPIVTTEKHEFFHQAFLECKAFVLSALPITLIGYLPRLSGKFISIEFRSDLCLLTASDDGNLFKADGGVYPAVHHTLTDVFSISQSGWKIITNLEQSHQLRLRWCFDRGSNPIVPEVNL